MIGDTIAAIATAPGSGGVGIIRISGEKAIETASAFFESLPKQKPRELVYGDWIDPSSKEILDEVMTVRFDAPKSYSGEDMVEVHAHGGSLNLKKLLQGLLESGCRMAQAGEFTQRAFVNGKMDLTQAEAVADLISAKAELSRSAAARQLKGGLFEKLEDWRLRLMDLSAQSEAAVDFPEEQDQIAPREQQLVQVRELLNEMRDMLDKAITGRLAREGLRVSIVGRPNVGKSSLLNMLLDSERAIVTDTKGTTRDYLEENFQIQGFPVVLVDTAGLRESNDVIEVEGIRRSKEQADNSDLRLLVLDSSEALEPEDLDLIKKIAEPRIILRNKIDLESKWDSQVNFEFIGVSSMTREGKSKVVETILQSYMGENISEVLDQALLTQSRHEDSLRKTEVSLSHVEETLASGQLGPEFVAGDLRSALDSLGEIVGTTTRDEVLNLIFSKFCIGK